MSVRVKLGTHTLPVSTGRVHGPCPRTVSTNRVHGPWVVFIELYLCLHHVRHDPCNTIPTDRHCESLEYCARHSCTVLTRGKKTRVTWCITRLVRCIEMSKKSVRFRQEMRKCQPPGAAVFVRTMQGRP